MEEAGALLAMNETLVMVLLLFFFIYSVVITLMYLRLSRQVKRMSQRAE